MATFVLPNAHVTLSRELMADVDLGVMRYISFALESGPVLGPGRAEWRAVQLPVRLPLTDHVVALADGEAVMLTKRCDRCGHLDAFHHWDADYDYDECSVDGCDCND